MTEFVFGPYRLLVDVERTQAYYSAHPLPWVTCGCAGCRNFVQAVKLLPPEAKGFFDALGLDPGKPGELCYYQGTERDLAGDGWYHLAGTVLEGGFEAYPAEWYSLAEGFSVGFKTACDLLPEDFPKPCFQMEFSYIIPWVMREPNPYL